MLIYYFEKGWWDAGPRVALKKRNLVDPQPKKPPLRPKWWVEFSDPCLFAAQADFKTLVGRIDHVVYDTKKKEYEYAILHAWSRYDVKIESIRHRMIPEADED